VQKGVGLFDAGEAWLAGGADGGWAFFLSCRIVVVLVERR